MTTRSSKNKWISIPIIKYLLARWIIIVKIVKEYSRSCMPLIKGNDVAKVYSAFSFAFLLSERLSDRASLPLLKEDVQQLNQLFKSANKINRRKHNYSQQKGVFINIYTDEGQEQRRGYYISDKFFIYLRDFNHYVHDTPREMRPQIKEFIERYRKQLSDSITAVQHDYQTIVYGVQQPTPHLFNLTNNTVYIHFFVLVDPLTVAHIEYAICKSKKWGMQVWRRYAPLWDEHPYCGIDKKGNIRVQSAQYILVPNDTKNSQVIKMASELFPKWEEMDNTERMKMLDSYYERYATLVYHNIQKKNRVTFV